VDLVAHGESGRTMETNGELDADDIEYWIRRGERLAPATDDEIELIHAWERESAALARLERLKAEERRWLRHHPLLAVMRAMAHGLTSAAERLEQLERDPHGETAHAPYREAHFDAP
jgi:hypothetical protein